MKYFLPIALSLSLIASCRTNANPEAGAELAADQSAATDKSGANAFGFDMYKTLAASAQLSDTNLFISPTSIATAFGMTYMGADGSTRDEMAKVLRIAKDHDQAGEGFKQKLDDLRATKRQDGYDLMIANKIWTAADIKFEKAFKDSTKKFFGSDAAQVNFKDAAARKQVIKDINQWASDNTNKRITQIVDDQFIRREMSIVLANAVYFLADWLYPFPNTGTPIKMDWKRADNKKVKATMMSHEIYVKHVDADGYQAVELPYKTKDGEDPRMSMVIVLPAEGKGLKGVDRLLNDKQWDAMIAKMSETEIRVTMPKWEVKGESIKLKEYLRSMGMKAAWLEYNPEDANGTANFSRMSKDRSLVSLSEALHKTFVKVDEKGTEAAAVTVVGGVRATSVRPQPKMFVADRPFIYAIRDLKNGQLIFIGRMLDPTSSK